MWDITQSHLQRKVWKKKLMCIHIFKLWWAYACKFILEFGARNLNTFNARQYNKKERLLPIDLYNNTYSLLYLIVSKKRETCGSVFKESVQYFSKSNTKHLTQIKEELLSLKLANVIVFFLSTFIELLEEYSRTICFVNFGGTPWRIAASAFYQNT